jgi:dihydropteroate synthase
MGILNVTPDSFSDGGHFNHLDAALRQAEKMVLGGASIIDIGGESTRPGADPVSEGEELERVVPVIEAMFRQFDVLLSIDTSKAKVMTEAAKAGADMINDVCALQQPGALAAAAKTGLPVCLMHMQGEPRTMQIAPEYANVVDDVLAFLAERIAVCAGAGIPKCRVIVDPGFGFGKTVEHNFSLLANLKRFQSLGTPVLAGLSRKSMLGAVTGKPVEQRLAASLAGALLAVQGGASILRVHDVPETTDAIKILTAAKGAIQS